MADAKTDDKLAAALKLARTTPMYFAYVSKGSGQGKLLLARKPIPPKQVAEAKAELGGGKVYKGRSVAENGTLIFETAAEPPKTLAKEIRGTASRDAGLTLKVEVRQATDAEEEPAALRDAPAKSAAAEKNGTPASQAAAPQEKPASPAKDLAAPFKDQLKALTPVYQKVTQAVPAQGATLEPLLNQALAAAKGGDYSEGLALLEQLKGALKEAMRSAAPAASPVKEAPDAAQAAAFKNRLKALTPIYQKAAQASPDRKPALDQLLGQATAAAKIGDFAGGLTALEELKTALQQVARAAPAAAPPAESKAPEKPPAAAPEEALFKSRLKVLRPKFDKALDLARSGSPDQAKELGNLFAELTGEAKAKQYDIALETLSELNALAQTVLRTAEVQAKKAAGPGPELLVKYKRRYEQARQTAAAELARYQQTVLSDPDVKDDPRYQAEIVPLINGLDDVFRGFDDALLKQLDAAAKATPETRKESLQKVRDLVVRTRKDLDGNEVLHSIEDGVYGTFNLSRTLAAALDDLSARLSR